MKRGHKIPTGSWPRLLRQARAADYCDVSPGFFKTHCDVSPIEWEGIFLWDRLRLDEWIDSMQDTGASLGGDPIMEAINGDSGAT